MPHETELDQPPPPPAATIRFEPPSPRWNTAWRAAYHDYAVSLGSPVDDAIATTMWAWLLAKTHGVEGLLAIEGDRLVGFTHFRAFPRTLDGNEAGYLDDLWVSASHRGKGLGATLIAHVCAIGRERRWSEVRWVTERDNPAQRLYERVATNWGLQTYRIRLD
ncbi:MAG TPA: GNAT family N-acetyltransferase [Candidatus Limnocylindria bacterium]|jgi:ribosomal protein S18 acetylase RimI-like enzyme|nr:GNAT family N-acetyltransferase [Candidatus Limnocylindria bacterium]